MTEENWIKAFETNFFYRHIMNELVYEQAYKNLKQFTGYDEQFIAIVMTKGKGGNRTQSFYHKAGVEKTAKCYFQLHKRGFAKKNIAQHDKLLALHKKLFPRILRGEEVPILDLKQVLMTGITNHMSTMPHCMELFEKDVEQRVCQELKTKSFPSILLESRERPMIERGKLSWLRIIIAHHKGILSDDIIKKHRSEFALLDILPRRIAGYKEIVPDIDYYKERLSNEQLSLQEAEQELHNMLKDKAQALKERDQLLSKLSLQTQKDVEALANIAHIRLDGRQIWVVYYALIGKQLSNIAKSMGLNQKQFDNCSFDELLHIQRTKLLPRKPGSAKIHLYYKEDESFINLRDKVAREMIKRLDLPVEDLDVDKLKGDVAYPGKVTGKAHIIHWGKSFQKEMREMQEGDILVIDQTKPDLMPAIRKASAIVTNEGGLTSHAAIVSRELKIPCVIKTGIATKVFKNGETITVDAQKGVVFR